MMDNAPFPVFAVQIGQSFGSVSLAVDEYYIIHEREFRVHMTSDIRLVNYHMGSGRSSGDVQWLVGIEQGTAVAWSPVPYLEKPSQDNSLIPNPAPTIMLPHLVYSCDAGLVKFRVAVKANSQTISSGDVRAEFLITPVAV